MGEQDACPKWMNIPSKNRKALYTVHTCTNRVIAIQHVCDSFQKHLFPFCCEDLIEVRQFLKEFVVRRKTESIPEYLISLDNVVIFLYVPIVVDCSRKIDNNFFGNFSNVLPTTWIAVREDIVGYFQTKTHRRLYHHHVNIAPLSTCPKAKNLGYFQLIVVQQQHVYQDFRWRTFGIL